LNTVSQNSLRMAATFLESVTRFFCRRSSEAKRGK
jgi:hypothetical protein